MREDGPAPVADWTADFDHLATEWAEDPHAIWDELRAHCPVAHTERYGGVWLPTRYDDIRKVAYDTEHFTSLFPVIVPVPEPPSDPWGNAPPLTSDPPYHRQARMLLLPAFAPKAVERLEPFTREVCEDLVDRLAGSATCDAVHDYAQHIPSAVITHLFGFPIEAAERFRAHARALNENVSAPPDERSAWRAEFLAYLDRLIEDHADSAQGTLLGYLLGLEHEGERLTHEQVRGMLNLIVVAGVHTTESMIGSSLWHLAAHPDDRRRLLDEPELLPTAVEELCRAYAPVSSARRANEGAMLAGHPLGEGDWVLLAFPAANRDPAHFDDPGRVELDREPNRHCTFGLGIHRCIGSGLARMEICVALETWLARIPDFELADPAAVRWSTGQTRTPRTIPLRLLRTVGPP